MKKPLKIFSLLAVLAATVTSTSPAKANNSDVEATLQSYADTSLFYQALVNTGVINELRENQTYTIFAPTNAALAQISPQTYPCFYAIQCRPQIATMMRNHIIPGRYDPKELTTFGQGIQAAGGRRLFIDEPYLNDFNVEGRNILSANDTGQNIIYRIDGVIVYPQEMSEFQTVAYVPQSKMTTTRKTTIHKATRRPILPEARMAPQDDDGNLSETTTITHTYETQPEEPNPYETQPQ